MGHEFEDEDELAIDKKSSIRRLVNGRGREALVRRMRQEIARIEQLEKRPN